MQWHELFIFIRQISPPVENLTNSCAYNQRGDDHIMLGASGTAAGEVGTESSVCVDVGVQNVVLARWQSLKSLLAAINDQKDPQFFADSRLKSPHNEHLKRLPS